MLSKACVVGIYQRKLELLAERGPLDLLVLVPPGWRDERGETRLERAHTRGYRLETLPIVRNGDFHLHHYRGLGAAIARFRPHLVHIDEEPYNLAAWQAHRAARRAGARSVFFTWQNIARRYPPPFAWGERWLLRTADAAIAGTQSAADVWRAKGFTRPIAVIPQFGTDAAVFAPAPHRPQRPFTVGYVGRLVEEKGLSDLLAAFVRLRAHVSDARLVLVGGGPERAALETAAAALGVGDAVVFRPQVPSAQVAAEYHGFDVLALPSRTRGHWKEQFGRVLVEAMASGVPVVGSDSGAIPDVIGDAGLIFPEGRADALAGHLRAVACEPGLAARLAERGRARAVAQFGHERVADSTLAVYRAVCAPQAG
jgi:glycosyltransferase involved in cell wall biosynthesis